LNNTSADEMGVIPDELGSGGASAVTNPFAGGLVISSANNGGTGAGQQDAAFIVSVGNLPAEACVTLATNDWGSDYSSGFIGMSISATTTAQTATATNTSLKTGCTTATAAAWCSSNKAMQVSTAATACKNGGSILWKFH
jgi:hypothetical protein